MTTNKLTDKRAEELARGRTGLSLHIASHEESMAMARELQEYRKAGEAKDKRIVVLEESHAQVIQSRDHYKNLLLSMQNPSHLMNDAMHAAVALTSAGCDLNDFDECVSRLHEWSALPDYCIALYVDFIHGLISENKLLDFGHIISSVRGGGQ
ncbi:hypothetical protein [Enterobacter mori]|uniref:hypothetical protein n=1 Tax=Enterobacter mori TaxID=539813 RepID=UPI003B8423C0